MSLYCKLNLFDNVKDANKMMDINDSHWLLEKDKKEFQSASY